MTSLTTDYAPVVGSPRPVETRSSRPRVVPAPALRNGLEKNAAAAIDNRIGRSIRDLHVEKIGHELIVSGITSSYYIKQSVTHAVLPLLTFPQTLTNAIRVNSKR